MILMPKSENPMELWLNRIDEVNLANAPHNLPQQAVRDTEDKVLGVLSPYMQRYWVYLEHLRILMELGIEKMTDIQELHRVDYRNHGPNLPEKMRKAFADKCEEMKADMKPICLEYGFNHTIFFQMLYDQFPNPTEPILGIREDFKVVCRTHDNRGDRKDALLTWFVLIGKIKDSDLFFLMNLVPTDAPTTPPA